MPTRATAIVRAPLPAGLDKLVSGVTPQSARALLISAISEFAARGYHATTTRDICKAAGMSPAAMYAHFESKEEMFFLAAKIGYEGAYACLADAIDDSQGPRERLKALVYAYTRWHADNAVLSRVALRDIGAASAEHRKVLNEIRDTIEQFFRATIDEGARRGLFKIDDEWKAMRAIMSMSVDIARWYQGENGEAHDIAESYADLALRMIS